jgi:hypothetical protein
MRAPCRDVDVVLEGRPPARRHLGRLLGEPVERLAVLFGEALRELDVSVLRVPAESASREPSARMSPSSSS